MKQGVSTSATHIEFVGIGIEILVVLGLLLQILDSVLKILYIQWQPGSDPKKR